MGTLGHPTPTAPPFGLPLCERLHSDRSVSQHLSAMLLRIKGGEHLFQSRLGFDSMTILPGLTITSTGVPSVTPASFAIGLVIRSAKPLPQAMI